MTPSPPSSSSSSSPSPAPEAPEASEEIARLQAAVGSTYEILRLIGRGGFADVYEARESSLARSVAIKVPRADVVDRPALRERFQREARATARLRHPNVVEIYTVGERNGVAYYVMPMVRGESLEERLERQGSIAPAEAERILMEAAAGLGAAHRAGLVHRDVKPENILLEGAEGRVVLTDFGIAKALEVAPTSEALTRPMTFLGTPHYLSPEQAAGDEVDARSDLYSLGVVGYRMVTGELPFDGPTVQALVAKHLTQEPPDVRSAPTDCPAGLAEVVHRCLEKDPDHRFADADELLRALREGAGNSVAAVAPAVGEARPAEEAGGPGMVEEPGPLAGTPLVRFRRTLAIFTALTGAAVLADALFTSSFTLPVLLVAGAFLTAGFRPVAEAGYTVLDLFRPGARPARTRRLGIAAHADLFGEHAEEVRAARACRGAILRLFHTLSRAEQDRFPDLMEAVDSAAGAIKQEARRLATLEERLASDEESSIRRRGSLRGGALRGELGEAHERSVASLRECIEALEQVRHWLTRSGGADSEAVHEQLVAAVRRTREAVRGRVS